MAGTSPSGRRPNLAYNVETRFIRTRQIAERGRWHSSNAVFERWPVWFAVMQWIWSVFPKRSAIILLLLVPIFASSVGAAGARAQVPLSRAERCIRLHEQLDAALQSLPNEPETVRLEALRDEALELCARGKASQGARTFAKALELVGRVPFEGSISPTHGKSNRW